MRRLILTVTGLLLALSAFSASKKEAWQDPSVNEINRLPMRATFVTDQQQTLNLNGVWKFRFNQNPESRLQGFESPALDDTKWDTIPVPGLWDRRSPPSTITWDSTVGSSPSARSGWVSRSALTSAPLPPTCGFG